MIFQEINGDLANAHWPEAWQRQENGKAQGAMQQKSKSNHFSVLRFLSQLSWFGVNRLYCSIAPDTFQEYTFLSARRPFQITPQCCLPVCKHQPLQEEHHSSFSWIRQSQLNPSEHYNLKYMSNILGAPVLDYLQFKPCLGMPGSLPWQLCSLVEAVTIVPYFKELLTSMCHKHIFLASYLSSDVSERFVALMEQCWVRGGHWGMAGPDHRVTLFPVLHS